MIDEKKITLLFNEAKKATTKSYAPYSHFRVGAAVLCSSGKIYSGCNVENSSYGLTICAERTAIVKAISEGENSINAIAIYSEDNSDYIYPCGACRQVLQEFAKECEVICFAKDERYKRFLLPQLFPNPF